MACYVDTSALVKLVVTEAESVELQEWFAAQEREPVACDLARTELMRAVRRVAPDRAVRARAVLESVTLLQVRSDMFETAGRLEPAELRSLDAIHLSAALDLGDDLDCIVCYDDRLAGAARAAGIVVASPGAD